MSRIVNGKDITFQVSSTNSAGNNNMADVIGNKQDNATGNSLYSQNYINYKHTHSALKVYPTLANGIRCTAAATAWKLGPEATIWTSALLATGGNFDVHFINVASIASGGIYELVLYEGSGAVATEIGRTKFYGSTLGNANIPVITLMKQTSKALRARVAFQGATAHTADISVMYHTY